VRPDGPAELLGRGCPHLRRTERRCSAGEAEPTHPAVLSALQTAHDAEATASEQFHKQEHALSLVGSELLEQRFAALPAGQ